MKNLINRTAVRSDPAKNFKDSDDFFNLVWEANVVVAAKSLDDHDATSTSSVDDLARKMVDTFVSLPDFSSASSCNSVYNYALDVINLVLIHEGFHDAIREGDGDRILLYWKVSMLLFKTSNNYSKEALLLLHQVTSLPERLAEQVKWSRFVNNRGRPRCNIPCEH